MNISIKKPHIHFTLVLLLTLLMVVPIPAFAALVDLSGWLYKFFITLGGIVTWLGGVALDTAIEYLVIGMGSLLRGPVGVAVDQLWTVVRDLFNLLFIFALIYLGLKTILKTEDTSTRKALGMLIVAALLINFSLLATKTIVDFTNLASLQIYNAITVSHAKGGDQVINFSDFSLSTEASQKSISGAFMQHMRLTSYANPDSLTNIDGTFSFRYIIFGFVIMLLMIMAGVVFLGGAIQLITRFVVLVLFMIASPLMLAGLILPQFNGYMKKWWRMFLANAFVAPAYLFMLYMSLVIIQKLGESINDVSYAAAFSAEATPQMLAVFTFFLLMAGFLAASLIVAKQMGAAGAGAAIGVAKGAGRLTAGSIASYTGGNLSAGGLWGVNRLEQALGRPIPLVSQSLRSGLEKGKKSTWGGFTSVQSRTDYTKQRKREIASDRSGTALGRTVKAGATAPLNSDAHIALSDAVSGTSPGDLMTQLQKYDPSSEEYKSIVSNMSAGQVSKIMDAKPEEFNGNQKAALFKVRQSVVKERMTRPTTPGGTTLTLGAAIRKATVEDLAALDLQADLRANAGDLQAAQLEKMKDNDHFKGPRVNLLKQAHEDALTGMSSVDIITSRTNDENIAKLPKDILLRPDFISSLPTTQLTNSLLTKIANRDDLNGSAKQSIGGAVRALYSAGTPMPSNLARFFTNGPGVQMA